MIKLPGSMPVLVCFSDMFLEALAQQPGFLRLQKKIHLAAKLNLCDFKGLWSSQSETLVNEIYTISVNWCS